MSGIYIHIPFCKSKCSYCNFHFSTNLALKNNLLNSIIKELNIRKNEVLDKNIKTIYFGGGTPSLLNSSELEQIINKIYELFYVDENPEITLESNPDDLDKNYLKSIKNIGINRLSIGVQSFFDDDLKLINRVHSANQSENSIKEAQNQGFNNINIDLMYGIQNASFEKWQKNLEKFIEFNVPHLSAYALTIEEKTEMYHLIKNNKLKDIDENIQYKKFVYIQDYLESFGFNQYEISNFAKENLESKHNTSYWKGKPYLGIGPSAHSFDGIKTRKWNIPNNSKYIKLIEDNKIAYQEEILSEYEQYNEFIMIGLRTDYGVDLKIIKQNFSVEINNHFQKILNKYNNLNYFKQDENTIKINKKFWFLSDGISSDFFIV